MNYGKNPHYLRNNLICISNIKIFNNDMDDFSAATGIGIFFRSTDYNTTIMLTKSSFHSVKIHPILHMHVHSRSILWIKHCKFQYNDYIVTDSILKESAAIQFDIMSFNVTLHFTNCSLYKNNYTPPLISIEVYTLESYMYNDQVSSVKQCIFTSHIHFEQCIFKENSGSLVRIFVYNIRSKCKIHFSMIGPIKIEENIGMREDIISVHNVNANIIGTIAFVNNRNARNIIMFYSCIVTFSKNISFILNGGPYDFNRDDRVDYGITLQSNMVYINVMENASIKFLYNTIRYQVIRVIVHNYRPYPYCLFQYKTASSKNASLALVRNYSINFRGTLPNNDIIPQDDDSPLMYYYLFHCKWLPEAIFNDFHMHPADINKRIIQIHKEIYQHSRVCYCLENHTHNCYIDELGPVFPGQLLQVNLCILHDAKSDQNFVLYVDMLNQFLPTSACKVKHRNEMINTISSSSNTYNFTIVSESKNECELFLTVQPDLYKRYDAFYVQLLPCPVGFTLQNGVCDCDPILSTTIDKCYIDYSAIRRPANSWIIAHAQTNNTKYLMSNNCPMDYCLPCSTNVNLLYPDSQCQFNRTGMLCSQCQHSLSMVFASSRCMKCTNVHILITIIVIVAGIVLVVLLYVLNLTVTNGTINGIIFYANIVSINDSVFLVNDNVFKPLKVFISFANLDLGIETCFYNGMDSYTKMWLQLFFPFHLIIIAISIIIASRYSTRIIRLTYSRSLPVLATVFLLSYTGVLRVVLTVLFSYSTITEYPSGDKEIVWSIDASVPLFGSRFIILFITCLVIILLLIPFNIALWFTKYLLQLKIVNHIKPILNSFQGSYKAKHYYWVAVQITLRNLFLTLCMFSAKLKLILSITLLITLTIFNGYICPNKNKVINTQEVMLLTNVTIMYAVSYQGNIFFLVANLMMSIAFAQFVTIVLYHFLTYTCQCDIIYLLKIIKQKLLMKSCNKRIQIFNHDSNNITECSNDYIYRVQR